MKTASASTTSKDHEIGSLDGELDDSSDSTAPKEKMDLPRIERAIREILIAVGEDPNREGLRETPARVARMYAEMFSGLHDDARVHLQKFFTEQYDEMVLVRDISFNSMCEHLQLLFNGVTHVAYIPTGCVTEIGKLARVAKKVARRPQSLKE